METRIIEGPHLGVEFKRNGAIVSYRVLEQDESLRNTDATMERLLAAEDEYAVYSSYAPEIEDGKCLWIRGYNKAQDNYTETYRYNDSDEALEALDAFTRLIERINAGEGHEKEEKIVGGPILKVKFCLEGSKLTAQILEQNEALRNLGEIVKQNDCEIRSYACPEMCSGSWGTILYIRGDDPANDNEIAQAIFPEPDEAEAALEALEKLIELINTAEIKTMEIGPYTLRTVLIRDKLLTSQQRRDAA